MKKILFCFLILLFVADGAIAQNASDVQLIQYYENAIKKAPNKSEPYDTLGMLYNSMAEEQQKAGNKTGAKESIQKAEKCFLTAVQKNGKDFAANFSLGVIYLNDAIAITKKLNEQDMDFSAAGKASYEMLKKENTNAYTKALQFFKQAEAIDPNHIQTLFGLKSIFGQLDDEEHLAVFTKRIKHLQNGETFDRSYFK